MSTFPGRIKKANTTTTYKIDSGIFDLIDVFSSADSAVSALYSFTNATFSSGGKTEDTGPSLTQARNGISSTGVTDWKNNTEFFNTTNGIQIWVVPQSGNYKIRAAGGRGGGNGGAGAIVEAVFNLTVGEVLYLLVGQTGNTSSCGGGGGGGTYVARVGGAVGTTYAAFASASLYPLLVGGGGGGQRDYGSDGPQAGSMGTFGTYETGAIASNGGSGGPGGSANGGGGWSTNGGIGGSSIQDRTDTGKAFINGGAGSTNGRSPGKFGGGSGATCEACTTAANAGAGGGYSGGGISTSVSACYTGGGGGGSFIHSTAIGTPLTSNGSWGNLSSPHSVYTGSVSSLGSFNNGTGFIEIQKVDA